MTRLRLRWSPTEEDITAARAERHEAEAELAHVRSISPALKDDARYVKQRGVENHFGLELEIIARPLARHRPRGAT